MKLVLAISLLFTSLAWSHAIFTVSGVHMGLTSADNVVTWSGATQNSAEGTVLYNGFKFWYTGPHNLIYTLSFNPAQTQIWPEEWNALGLSKSKSLSDVQKIWEASGLKTFVSRLSGSSQNLTRLEGTFISEDRRVLTIKFDFNSEGQLVYVTVFGMPRPQ